MVQGTWRGRQIGTSAPRWDLQGPLLGELALPPPPSQVDSQWTDRELGWSRPPVSAGSSSAPPTRDEEETWEAQLHRLFFKPSSLFFFLFEQCRMFRNQPRQRCGSPCSLDSVDAYFSFPAGGSPLANGRRVSVVDCCWTPKEPEAPRETKQDALDPQSNHHRGRLSLSKDPVPMEGSGRIHRASPAPSCSPARLNQAGP